MNETRHQIQRQNAAVYAEIESVCNRIVCNARAFASVEQIATVYVLDGVTFKIKTKAGEFPFWVGINGPRLFFIVYVAAVDPVKGKEIFDFCFGGAKEVGWKTNFEPVENGTSIWATCMTDQDRPLATMPAGLTAEATITPYGVFWATDIVMMVQSWILTCERNNITRHALDPAPL